MVEKLKFYLGYDYHKSVRAIDAQSMIVCGGKGSGKTLFLNNFIYNLLLHNSRDIFQIKFYTDKYDDKNVVFRDKSNVLPLIEFINESERKNLNDFIQDAIWEVEDRENTLRLSGCSSIDEYNELFPDKRYRELVYIVDGLSLPITYGSHGCACAQKIVEYGEQYGVYLVLTDTELEHVPNSLVDAFGSKVVLACSEEASKRVLGCDIAANSDISTQHIAIYKDKNLWHGLQYFRVPLISKEKMRLALDVFNQL